MKRIERENGTTMYLNSGDWIENLTALEYQHQRWSLYEYEKDELAQKPHLNQQVNDLELVSVESNNAQLFAALLAEFNITKHHK